MSLASLLADPSPPAAEPARIEVHPLTPVIGAELSGVDLRQPVDSGALAAIHAALLQWRVLVLRDRDIGNEQLLAFGRRFGRLTPAHPIALGLPDHPEIWERKAAEYKERREEASSAPPSAQPPRDYKGWHIDITFVANPNRYSLLHGVQIPRCGGDTIFANLVAAYQGLSAPIRRLTDGLQAVHRTSSYDAGKPRPGRRDIGPFASLHPLVRIHPETGEKVLFVNPGTTSHVAGLREPESKALLDLLADEITRPEYQVRIRWAPKTLVIWDNQAVAHAGPIDYAHFDEPRVVRRITVEGELPRGPDGFRSRPIEGELFPVIG